VIHRLDLNIRHKDWVVCVKGIGFRHNGDVVSKRKRHFQPDSIGSVREIKGGIVTVWLIGPGDIWDVPFHDVKFVDVQATGDKFSHKICNVCHRLLPLDQFRPNQNKRYGIIRRPSCIYCRIDIDKRPPKTKQAKALEEKRPKIGDQFECPICERRSIAGITAKVVADHNHHTGDIRDFICDSCNTGLGRFKNGKNFLYNAIRYLEERETKPTKR